VSLLLSVIVLGAVEDEGAFWTQLLMVVILAAAVGVYGLVKSRAKRNEQQVHDEVIETIIESPKSLLKTAAFSTAANPEHRRIEWPAASEIKPRQKDLNGGMELLARNFLVSVVERTDSPDQRDIAMRRLCFTELSRRDELWSIASAALKIYTLDEDGFYGKIIRCEAMAQLAGRTSQKPQDTAEIHDTSQADREPASSAPHHGG
jgi:hypothetical protein